MKPQPQQASRKGETIERRRPIWGHVMVPRRVIGRPLVDRFHWPLHEIRNALCRDPPITVMPSRLPTIGIDRSQPLSMRPHDDKGRPGRGKQFALVEQSLIPRKLARMHCEFDCIQHHSEAIVCSPLSATRRQT